MQTLTGQIKANQIIVSSSEILSVLEEDYPNGIQLKALNTNAGLIYIGNTDVSSIRCYPLAAGESVFLPLPNGKFLRVLASVNGDKLHYLVL